MSNELNVLSVEALVGSLEFRGLLAAVKTVRVVVDSLCNLFLCEVLDIRGFMCVVGDFDAVDARSQLLGVHDFLTGCERVFLCCHLNRKNDNCSQKRIKSGFEILEEKIPQLPPLLRPQRPLVLCPPWIPLRRPRPRPVLRRLT